MTENSTETHELGVIWSGISDMEIFIWHQEKQEKKEKHFHCLEEKHFFRFVFLGPIVLKTDNK